MADHINDCQPKMISAAGEDNTNTQLKENDAIINDDDEENEYDVQPDNPMFVRVVKTCAMCGIYLCLGMNQGILSPTLIDLSELQKCSISSLSKALMNKSFGVLAGSLLGGIVADKWRPRADIYIAMATLVGGLSIAAVPWCPTLVILGLVMFMQGLTQGSLNVVQSAVCIGMWGAKASLPIHAIHTFYAVGLAVSQPISAMFLSDSTHTNPNKSISDVMSELWITEPSIAPSALPHFFMSQETKSHTGDFSVHSNNTDVEYLNRISDFLPSLPSNQTQIYIPYGGAGGVQIVMTMVFTVFSIFGCISLRWRYRASTVQHSLREMLNPAACSGGQGAYGVYMLISLFLLYVGIVARDTSCCLYICPIAVNGLNVTKQQAALLSTGFSISQTVGRLLSVALALCVPITGMVWAETTLILVFLALLATMGLNSFTLLWVFLCAFGVATGPNYPSVMAWADRYIQVTGFVMVVIDLGIGLGGFAATWAAGQVYDNYPLQAMFFFSLIAASVMAVILIPLQVASCHHGDRHKDDKNGITDSSRVSSTESLIDQDNPLSNDTSPLIS